MGFEALVDDVTDVTSWRERAERAEARAELAEQRAELAERRAERAEARVEELAEQVAVLSRMLFGRSSEKGPAGGGEGGPDDAGGATDPDGSGEQAGDTSGATDGQDDPPKKRGQRPGSKGHGRRDDSHLESREEIHDVPPGQRVCPDCGRAFDALGSEGSEQIDWQVRLIRIVHRRLRYRRACACAGHQQRLTVVGRVPPCTARPGKASRISCSSWDPSVTGESLPLPAHSRNSTGRHTAAVQNGSRTTIPATIHRFPRPIFAFP